MDAGWFKLPIAVREARVSQLHTGKSTAEIVASISLLRAEWFLTQSRPPRELLKPCRRRHLDRRPHRRLVYHDTRGTLQSALARRLNHVSCSQVDTVVVGIRTGTKTAPILQEVHRPTPTKGALFGVRGYLQPPA